MGKSKTELLSKEVRHLGTKNADFMSVIAGIQGQAGNLIHATHSYDPMSTNENGRVIPCLASSLVSKASGYAYSKGSCLTGQDREFGKLFAHATHACEIA